MSVGGEGPARLQPETIGKYRILEPIGRGGMGIVFKAHDPILDRLVALKVIAPDVQVSDELRTRFFREAKACAKLNHPNIVTVHEMGEDAGRLFIVMEFLQGEELRQIIKANTPLTLEDKLSLMRQVCRGLHYAHQQGVVHRDMKPANIFVLRDGTVKIVDFGIAHLATTDPGLTRTGLILGTLRYISPEQVSGRVDPRSDMFSLGSVLYELLTLRPPFLGDDPMQLLEQLRSEDPPPPTQVDPTIPLDLEAVVQRAMRKNPDERYRDLDEMGAALEAIHSGLIEERQRVLARVRRQREQIVQLEAALADRIGSSGEEASVRGVAERHGLMAALAAEREFAGRIEALQAKMARADALAPSVQSAEASLEAGRFDDAARQFETVVADMPDHLRAAEGLGRARTRMDTQRLRRLAADLLQKARVALDGRLYALCLEILKEAGELPLPDDVRAQLASLRETALASQEAFRRSRQEADEAHERMSERRGDAHAADAAQHASGLWNEAEAMATAAQGALRREACAEARQGFEQAAAMYGRALEAARRRHGQEQHAAQHARDMAMERRNQALLAEATQYARELWDAAEARSAEAHAALAAKTWAGAGAALSEASALYRRAEETAREARERERRRAEAARERAAEARRRAEAMDAEHQAASAWNEAAAKSAEAEAAWLRKQYARAIERFEAALALYHGAQAQVREIIPRQRDEVRQKQQQMTERRRSALAAEAATLATPEWNEAEASAAAGEAALARDAWSEALGAFEQAASLYRRAEERARETVRARVDADKAAGTAEQARRAAAQAGAGRHASEAWTHAEQVAARAVARLGQQDFTAARTLFDEAARLYTAAAQSALTAAGNDSARRQPASADAEATVLMPPREAVARDAVPEDATVLASTPTPVAPIPRPATQPDVDELKTLGKHGAIPAAGKPPRARSARPKTRTVAVAIGALGVILVVGGYWRYQSSPSPSSPDRFVSVAPPTPASTPNVVPPGSPPAGSTPASTPSAASPPAAPPEPSADREPAGRRPGRTPSAGDEAMRVEKQTSRPSKRTRPQTSEKGVASAVPTPARPPSAVEAKPAAPPPGPAAIRKSIEEKLQTAGLLRRPGSDEPGVAVEDVGTDGSVKLVGVLKDAAARQAAAELVRTIAGVRAVDVRRVTVQKGWTSQ